MKPAALPAFAPALLAPALLALTAAPALARPNVASQVAGLAVLRYDTLPAAPQPGADRAACAHLLLDRPATPAGQRLAQLGWGVTAEEPLGGWTAVSFVSGYGAGTSGSCELSDGNIGLFQGDQLQILVYATDRPATQIGHLVPFGQGGLRLFSGDFLPQPVADLRVLGTDGLIITQPALEEKVCGGRAVLPYLYGLPIDMARQLLAEAGWQPAPPAEPLDFGIAQDLAASVPEVQACAGTGFGFCAFNYTGPAGRLDVTTVGEGAEDGSLPQVADYVAECAP